MATLSVEVETNELGTAKVFYVQEEARTFAEIQFFPKLGVLINMSYHYEYTETYDPGTGEEPQTIKGEGDGKFSNTGNGYHFQDENCPLYTTSHSAFHDYDISVSYKMTITGDTSVFPYKIIPEGSVDIRWFYRDRFRGHLYFNWNVNGALDRYDMFRMVFFYSSDDQIPNEKHEYTQGRIMDIDEAFKKCTLLLRKFTYLPLYDEKSKKLICVNHGELCSDGDRW